MACDVNALLRSGNQFVGLGSSMRKSLQIELLRQIAGNTQSVQELMTAAAPFEGLNASQRRTIKIELLCRILT